MKALKWFIIFLVVLSIAMLVGMAYLVRMFSEYAVEEVGEESLPSADTQLVVPE